MQNNLRGLISHFVALSDSHMDVDGGHTQAVARLHHGNAG